MFPTSPLSMIEPRTVTKTAIANCEMSARRNQAGVRPAWFLIWGIALIAVLAGFCETVAHAQTVDKLQGLCTRGGQVIQTAGAGSSQKAEMVVPSCTVTIYIAGTLTPATIYADRATVPTPKANPFTASTSGEWFFYATQGRYDIRLSGGTPAAQAYPAPVTYGDMWIVNPGSATPITQAYQTITKDQVALTQRSKLEFPGSSGIAPEDSSPLASTVIVSERIPVGAYNVVEKFKASGIPDAGTGSINSGNSVLTMNTFPSGYLMAYYWKVGQGILVAGAGVAGADLITTVTAVGSTTITLATPASTTVAAVRVQHDDTAAIQAAINNVANGNTHIWFPEGGYLVTSTLTIPTVQEGRSLIFSGTGKSGSTIFYQGLGSLFAQSDTSTTIDSLDVHDLAFATSTPGAYSTVRPTVNQGSAFDFSYSQVVNFPKWTNVRFIGWGRWAIFCANCQGGWISNSIFRSNAQGHIGLIGPETLAQVDAAEANANSIRDSQLDLAPNISNTDTALTGLSMTTGSYTLTSGSSVFSSTHAGRLIRVTAAGISGGDLLCLIKTYNSTTSVTLSCNNQTGGNLTGLAATIYKSNLGSIYLHRANNTTLGSLTIQGNFSGSTRNEFGVRVENSYNFTSRGLWIEDTGGGTGHDLEFINSPSANIIGYKSNADPTASTGNTHGGNIKATTSPGITVYGMQALNPTKHFDLDATSSLFIEGSQLSSPDNIFNTFDQSRLRIAVGEGVTYQTGTSTGLAERGTTEKYDDPLVNTVLNGRFEDGTGGMTSWTDTNPTYHTRTTGTGRYSTYQTINTSALADSATANVAFSQVVSIPDNYQSGPWTLGFDLYVQSFGTTPTTNRYVQVQVVASGSGVGYDDFSVKSLNTSNLASGRWERIVYTLQLPSGTGRTFTINVRTTQGPTTPIVRLANFRLSPGKHVLGTNDQPLTELQGGVVRNFLEFVGQSAPALSSTGRARIYVDTSGVFQCSENGGAYSPCGSGGGSSVTDYLGAINVKKAPYSCTGDGIANDTACVTTALAAAVAATGRPLYFPNGTYLVDSGTLTLATNGVIITGDSPGKSVIKARTNTSALITIDASAVNPHTITIQNLTLEGFGSGANNHGIRFTGANTPFNIQLRNLILTNFTGRGIYDTSGIFQSKIENVVITMNSGGDNAFDLIGSNDLVLLNNYVTTVANTKAAYRIHSGRPTLIGNNGVNPGSTNGSWGVFGNITAEDGSDSYVFGNFSGNNIEDFSQYGLRFKEGSFGYFHGNTILAPSSGTVTPLKFDFVDVGQKGIWDATNSINTQGATYTNGNPINSRGAPFIQIGGTSFTSYYDTTIVSSISFPYISPNLVPGSTDIAMVISRAQITALNSSNLAGDFTGTTDFIGNASRVLLQDGTAARPTFTYSGDTDSGFYRSGANILGFAAGGAEIATLSTSAMTLGRSSAVAGKLTLYNGTNANTISIQSGVSGSNLTFTLPTADGSSGHCLKTNGSGTLSFSSCAGSPSLTATFVGYGDGSNLLTGTSDFSYNTTTKTLSIVNGSGSANLILNGSSDTSKVTFGAGSIGGSQGGILFPFVGGSQSSGPGVCWASSASYATTSCLNLRNGLTFQGANSTHDNFKLAEGTGTSSDGTVRYTFAPSSSLFTQNLSTGVTTTTHDAMQTDLVSSGGAGGANFGAGWLFRLENASSALTNATRLSVNWTTATGGAETSRFVIANNNAGGGVADSFTVEGDQYYGSVNALGNKTGSFTIDFKDGNHVTATATGNWSTVTFSNIKPGARYVLKITQDATGGRTWTPPTTFKYPGGIAGNILTGTANAVDVFICDAFDSTNIWCNGLFDVKNP